MQLKPPYYYGLFFFSLAIISIILLSLMPDKEPTPSPAVSSPSPSPAASSSEEEVKTARKVVLSTNKGDIAITLFPEDSPRTVANFVTLGDDGYYEGVTFHRVIADFMIQGGDPTGTGAGGESIYGSKFADEFNDRPIVRGSLAMANAGPNTNGSQFFIVTRSAQPHLDGRHTNFGQVDEASMAVVDAIASVDVDMRDKPLEPVTITGFSIIEP